MIFRTKTGSGGGVSGMTPGSVLFADASGNAGEDNANLFWDATNKRLGIGTTSFGIVDVGMGYYKFKIYENDNNLYVKACIENGCTQAGNNKAFAIYDAVANGGAAGQFGAYATNYNDVFFAGFAKAVGYKNGLIIGAYEAGGVVKLIAGGSTNEIFHFTSTNSYTIKPLYVGTSDTSATAILYSKSADVNNNAAQFAHSVNGGITLLLNGNYSATSHLLYCTDSTHIFFHVSGYGNIGIGTNTYGTNARYTLNLLTGAAPTASVADQIAMYSADIVAGNAAPHFRTENGKIIKLYQQAHIVDADGTLADITTKFNTLLANFENLGLLATA